MDARFLPAGDTAVIVEFGVDIDRAVSERVLRLSARVREAALPGVIETVPTFRSLAIHYDPLATTGEAVTESARHFLDDAAGEAKAQRLWRVPACYEEPYGPDLTEVAQRTGLTPAEVVSLHTTTQFHVYMVGFLPGFPYMGDLPPELVLPRRTDPRVRVPAGSVAMAMAMTGVYPVESPGGWHLIGATPIRLFDLAWEQPAQFSPGDAVRFDPITADEFEAVRSAVERGDYVLPSESVAG
jgi:KipI family sensor histidine kinase inhibitor